MLRVELAPELSSSSSTSPDADLAQSPLSSSELNAWCKVTALRLPAAERTWVEALGLPVGERVCVVRRAPFGGPLHVRTALGVELALDRSLAAHIDVVAAQGRQA